MPRGEKELSERKGELGRALIEGKRGSARKRG